MSYQKIFFYVILHLVLFGLSTCVTIYLFLLYSGLPNNNYFYNDLLSLSASLFSYFLSGIITGICIIALWKSKIFWTMIPLCFIFILFIYLYFFDCVVFWAWFTNIFCSNKYGQLRMGQNWQVPQFSDILERWKIIR